MKALVTILSLTLAASFASAAGLGIKKCAPNADKVMKAIEKTYKNPALLELQNSVEDSQQGEYVYIYAFDYAVPYDDNGRAQMESKIVEIRTTNWDCSVRTISFN